MLAHHPRAKTLPPLKAHRALWPTLLETLLATRAILALETLALVILALETLWVILALVILALEATWAILALVVLPAWALHLLLEAHCSARAAPHAIACPWCMAADRHAKG
jgi:hypothetical protein